MNMTVIDYEKEINSMPMYKRYSFICDITDENIRASLLSFLDDSYAAKIIESFKDESLVVQTLFLLKPSSTKLRIVKNLSDDSEKFKYLSEFSEYDKVELLRTFNDDSLKLSSLSMLDSTYRKLDVVKLIKDVDVLDKALPVLEEYNRVDIINSRDKDSDKELLLKHLSKDNNISKVLSGFASDDEKIRLLNTIKTDNYKAEVLLSISSEEQRLNALGLLKEAYTISNVIDSFTDEANIIQALPYLNKSYHCKKHIKKITDDNVKVTLLDNVDEYERVEIVLSFDSDELKYKGLLTIDSDYRKDSILSSITDLKYLSLGLSTYKSDWNKKGFVSSLEDENIRVQLLSHFSNDSDKADIVKGLSDEVLKIGCLDLLKSEESVKKVVLSLIDEQDRFKYLERIKDDSNKVDIISTFTSQGLIVSSLEQVKSSYNKRKVIGKITDEKTIIGLFKYLDDYDKSEFVGKFSTEQLKCESLQYFNSDYYKTSIIKTFTDFKYIEDGIKLLKEDWNKLEIIKLVSEDNDKVSLLQYIESESYKVNVICELKDDSFKIDFIDSIKDSTNIAKVISSFVDDNTKLDYIDRIQYEWDKVSIVSSIIDEDILSRGLSLFKDERYKANVLVELKDDRLKVKFLSIIEDDSSKVRIIKSIKEDLVKVEVLTLINDEKAKVDIINSLKDEHIRLSLVPNLENNENKFLVIAAISSKELKNNALKSIDNYKEVMNTFFEKGNFEYLYHFDKDILREVFDKKQIEILEEYTKIKNENIRKSFSNYVVSNYDNLNMVNLGKISQILTRIELSNSSELQAFGDLIASQVLNSKDPIRYFNKVEDVFIRNNIPYVGKIFEVFKLLHTNSHSYRNYSPLLNRFTSDVKYKMMDIVIFNDLLKCSFGSNNRNLKEFINEIEKGSNILDTVMKDSSSIDLLNDKERFILNKYLDRIEIILSNYDEWKFNKTTYSNKDFLLRIKAINERLKVNGSSYNDIPDIIMRKLCGVAGINSLDSARVYLKTVVEDADKRNRVRASEEFSLEVGDFVKGINDVKYLSRILQNGSVSKEFLGEASDSDLTPLDTDLSRILAKDVNGKNGNELGNIISSTVSGSYGSTWFVLKNDPDRIDITRDEDGERNRNLAPRFSKLEAFKTMNEGHYGIRTGFPTSEISYIVSRDNFERIGLEVAMNGFYIPVVDTKGKLVFTPEDYDLLRSKMSGLKFYDNSSYSFSDNLVCDDVLEISSQIESSNIEVSRKRELINNMIRESLLEMDLIFKDNIDGDLSEGVVELVDTGSTGRGTNKPGDGDFDFMMRLDKSIISNPDKLDELKDRLLNKFGVQGKSQVTASGDFRLKDVGIDSDTKVDIDITFIGKTDKVSYSTDMCLSDRLESIKSQDPEKFNYVVANILLAKQVLKQGECYKPNRGELPQGGLGGVGVENWILQNGGSFIDAARSFVEASEGNDFETFKSKYKIWDFGENHMAEKNGYYAHDEFVSRNMSSSGYSKMVSTLKTYLRDYSFDTVDSKKVI